MASRRPNSWTVFYVILFVSLLCSFNPGELETMSTEFEANHDGCTVMDTWDTVIDAGALLASNVASRLDGSICGVEAAFTSANSKILFKTITPPVGNQYRLRFWFDPNGLTSALGNLDILTVAINNPSSPFQRIDARFRFDAGFNHIMRFVRRWDSDVGDTIVLDDVAVSDEPHCVEIRVVRESSSSGNDGELQIYLDGVELYNQVNEQNFTAFSVSTRYTVSWTSSTSPSGTTYGDEFILDNNADADLGCSAGPITDEWTAAPMKKPCSIDMDGDFIYIAALDSLGQPTLIKFSTALNVDGSIVFQPGAGDNIGVEVGKKDADVVWVAGNFGGTDTVEKSEDAGASFTVKDDGTFDPVTSFVVGSDSDERVLIFTDAGGSVASTSIYETIDDGASWETKNSGLGLVSKAVERLDINAEELVTGNESSATDNIDYSPNSGEDLEDYSTGFPEVDVTSLVVG